MVPPPGEPGYQPGRPTAAGPARLCRGGLGASGRPDTDRCTPWERTARPAIGSHQSARVRPPCSSVDAGEIVAADDLLRPGTAADPAGRSQGGHSTGNGPAETPGRLSGAVFQGGVSGGRRVARTAPRRPQATVASPPPSRSRSGTNDPGPGSPMRGGSDRPRCPETGSIRLPCISGLAGRHRSVGRRCWCPPRPEGLPGRS